MTHSGDERLDWSEYDGQSVLIPLLLDDPLWVAERKAEQELFMAVLIPLLLDDPLWGFICYSYFVGRQS